MRHHQYGAILVGPPPAEPSWTSNRRELPIATELATLPRIAEQHQPGNLIARLDPLFLFHPAYRGIEATNRHTGLSTQPPEQSSQGYKQQENTYHAENDREGAHSTGLPPSSMVIRCIKGVSSD